MTYPRNIWDSKESWLIIPSNTQGIAGAGLAKQAAVRYPEQTEVYRRACQRGVHAVGYPVITPINPENRRYQAIYWFASKTQVSQPSRLSYIDTGFDNLAHQLASNPSITVALPPVGCGLGGLQLHHVVQLYNKHLKPYFADRINLVGDWGSVDPNEFDNLYNIVHSEIEYGIMENEDGDRLYETFDSPDAASRIVTAIGEKYRLERKELE